jgi:RNA polymerase sigma factor for flagellar operon FliA
VRADQLTSLLREHAPLVRKIASEFMGRVPASVEMDDLVQVGMIGLWQAYYHFNHEQGASIATFARHRVRGAMLDELRACDTMSRDQRERARAVSVAALSLAHGLGREPTLGELAQATSLSLGECSQAQTRHITRDLDDLRDVAGPDTPQQQHELGSMRAAVAKAIERLPEHERSLVEQHIDQDQTLADIAIARGISESRACQIYQGAIKRLRTRLWAWRDSNALQA